MKLETQIVCHQGEFGLGHAGRVPFEPSSFHNVPFGAPQIFAPQLMGWKTLYPAVASYLELRGWTLPCPLAPWRLSPSTAPGAHMIGLIRIHSFAS